jgi:hypothetical protein
MSILFEIFVALATLGLLIAGIVNITPFIGKQI